MKKKLSLYLQLKVLPYLVHLLVRLLHLTNKKVYHYSKDISKDENLIIASWHGDLLMQPFNYYHLKKDGVVKVIVSEHKDGELIKKVFEYLGVEAIRGSSSKGGAKALIGAIKALKNGIDVAITPDGPRGPIYSIADGIVAISQKTQTRILPFSSIPTKYWQIKSWDKFIIPKPFGTINFYIGEPFSIENLDKSEAKELIYKKMMENQLDK